MLANTRHAPAFKLRCSQRLATILASPALDAWRKLNTTVDMHAYACVHMHGMDAGFYSLSVKTERFRSVEQTALMHDDRAWL